MEEGVLLALRDVLQEAGLFFSWGDMSAQLSARVDCSGDLLTIPCAINSTPRLLDHME